MPVECIMNKRGIIYFIAGGAMGKNETHLKTPLYDALAAHIARRPVSFHMPGHRGGSGFQMPLTPEFDLTELDGLDNLHGAEGCIRQAQELAASAFGADHTRFLVNGSTSGLHAAILCACGRGGGLIVAGDCHKSVINAAILADAGITKTELKFDRDIMVPAAVTPGQIEETIRLYPDASAVIVTRPTYYGLCCDLREIAEIAHNHGMLLIADEAHGAHLGFAPGSVLPKTAMSEGADISVQSAHKTLAALTQGAYLHVRSGRVDIRKLDSVLSMIQTSSPSYMIMASLDLARAQMSGHGSEMIERQLRAVESFTKRLNAIVAYKVLVNDDRTRVVINIAGTGLTGFEIARLLSREYGVFVEMGDFANIVLITTPFDGEAEYSRLLGALRDIAGKFSATAESDAENRNAIILLAKCYACEMGNLFRPAEAFYAPAEFVSLRQAQGRTISGMITPYPPGIPIACPGNTITHEIIDCVSAVMAANGGAEGVDAVGNVKVVKL